MKLEQHSWQQVRFATSLGPCKKRVVGEEGEFFQAVRGKPVRVRYGFFPDGFDYPAYHIHPDDVKALALPYDLICRCSLDMD